LYICKKQNLKRISKIHDRFFKQIFSYLDVMRVFIEQTFPDYIVNKLNLNTLVNDTNSYIDGKLKENFSDLVYTCFSNTNLELKIALLFEHKSKAIDYPQFQLMNYIEKIGETCQKQGKKRVFVLPIIFYHGQEKWIKTELHQYYGKMDDVFKRFIPTFDYILIDTSELTDEKIKNYKLYELQISLYLFKYIFNKEELKLKFDIFFAQNKQLTKNEEVFMLTFLEYLENNLNKDDMETVFEKVNDYTTSEGNIFVENYNKRIREEGMEKEKINNIKILLVNKILTVDEIANLFNVTLEYVMKIKNSL